MLVSFCFYSVLSAQETKTSDTPPAREINTQARPIEEITVIGQQSLFRLRQRVIEKEEDIFEFFNANNSSNQMDIICNRRAPIGSQITRRLCEPRFFKNLRSEKTRGELAGFNVFYTHGDLMFEAEPDFEKLQNELLSTMLTNRNFAEMLGDLADLSDNYKAHREELFPKDND
jgi:hypothetical protein